MPFNEEPAAGKYRPVLIIGNSKFGPDEDGVLLVVPLTTFGDGGQPRNGDVPISAQEAAAAGLSKAGWVRARRLWGINPRALDHGRGCTGEVTPEVMSLVLLEAEKLFA